MFLIFCIHYRKSDRPTTTVSSPPTTTAAWHTGTLSLTKLRQRRRGVSIYMFNAEIIEHTNDLIRYSSTYYINNKQTNRKVQRFKDDVIRVIFQKHLNGDEDRMVHVHFVMLVAFTMQS